MKHGFVYLLGNVAMPGRFKVGFTMNSPFHRAEELSRATGVPVEFSVLGFIAISDPQSYEAEIHRRLAARRTAGREFFTGPLVDIWHHFKGNEDASCIVDVEVTVWIREEAEKSRRAA